MEQHNYYQLKQITSLEQKTGTQTDRIAVVEQKTGNQTVTTLNTTFAGANGIVAQKFIQSGGLTTQFLKANGDTDNSTYLKSTDISSKLNKTGDTMSGSLAMGNNGISGVSSITLTSGTGFLKANGNVDNSTYVTNTDVSSLVSKTQNITALQSSTTSKGILTMTTTSQVLDNPLILSSATLITPNTPTPLGSIGMRFTISTTISIFRIGIPKIHWTPGDIGSIPVRFFQEGNPVMYAGALVPQSSIYGDYYVINLSLVNRKVLPPGTYRVSYGYYYHMQRYAIANAPMTFSPSIFNVEACSAPIDVAEYPTNVSVGLQVTFGGMFWFDDLGNIGTVLAPLIQTDKLVINSKTSDDILLGNGTYASLTRISNLETKTVNITDGATYLPAGTIVNSSIPYIDSSGALSSAGTNLYVQGGVNTIQSALDSIQSGLGYSIQTSASSFSESLTLSKQNIILSGVSCPMYVPTSQITGNITIGSATGTSTLYKIQNLKIVGNLSWISSSLNELRTYFSNCEFTGNITFPAVSGGGTTWIYFFNCSMNYASSIITIPNQSTYNIVFIRCNFNNQTITNNLVVGNTAYLTFRDCIGLPNLTLGNSVKYGMNATVAGGNSLSAVGLSLGGVYIIFNG